MSIFAVKGYLCNMTTLVKMGVRLHNSHSGKKCILKLTLKTDVSLFSRECSRGTQQSHEDLLLRQTTTN